MKIEEAIKSKGMSAQLRAVVNVMYTGNHLQALSNNSLREYNISSQQFNVLRILKGSLPDALTVQSIKSRMLDKTPNMTRLIDRLLEKGLVARERSEEDRRVVFVTITEQGLGLLDEIDQAGGMKLNLGELTEGELNILSSLLDKLRND